MSELSTERQGLSRAGKITVGVVIALIVLAFISAFAWPRWAIPHRDTTPTAAPTPTIAASELPENASALVSALPSAVGRFARQSVIGTANWASSGMIEEYTVTYSDGNPSHDVTLLLAQWPDTDSASGQYNALKEGLSGTVKAKGSVLVNGAAAGEYVLVASSPKDGQSEDEASSTALWINSTVIFRATGIYGSVNDFYNAFPL